MRNRAISFPSSTKPDRATHSATSSGTPGVSLSLPELEAWAKSWFLDCEISQHSDQTLVNRKYMMEKLLWFLRDRDLTECSAHTLRQFLHHAGKKLPPGTARWGNDDPRYQSRPEPKAGTVATYHRMLTAFFHWIIAQDGISASPMEKIASPIDRADQITPFTQEQVNALLLAARKSPQPRRNEAILLLFLDTGMRVSELCGLKMEDIDIQGKTVRVDGKGGKERRLPVGKKTSRALWMYLREQKRLPEDSIFLAEGGWKVGQGISRSGVEQMIRALGQSANINNLRCSPHTLRHTMAVMFLRNGGNQFTLMQILGHEDVKMTTRYVKLAQADIEAQHRRCSPVDRMEKICL